jgi:hypothetical protein
VNERRRFGRPQIYAVLLLFGFLAQAVWLAHVQPINRIEVAYARAGLDQFHGKFIEPAAPSVPIAAAAFPVLLSRRALENFRPDTLKWLVRAPFIVFGWLLGASVWYVSRRLYGNAGGYLALTLYCFSPVPHFALPGPIVTGSLGAFGIVFVAIATAHTLYARSQLSEPDSFLAGLVDIRLRWYRIVLLAIAIMLAVGSSYWLVFLLIVAEAFMVYIVPDRQFASVGLVVFACAIAFLGLFAIHGFHWHMYWSSLRHAPWLPVVRGAASRVVLGAYLRGWLRTMNPALLILTVAALIAYASSARCRYFGNSAPLGTLVFLTVLSLLALSGVFTGPFPLLALPFLAVFISGIFADLGETSLRPYVLVFTLVLLGIYISTALMEVWKVRVSVLY